MWLVDKSVDGTVGQVQNCYFYQTSPHILVDIKAIWCYNIHILKQKEFDMTERSAMFLVITGLIMTMLGAGGIENSFETVELIQSILVSIVGLAVMGCGVLAIKVAQNG
jgi:hypothetical protein